MKHLGRQLAIIVLIVLGAVCIFDDFAAVGLEFEDNECELPKPE